jgi:hypothetical protein
MSQDEKIWEKILNGKSDANFSFNELKNFLIKIGFVERINGSHHIFEFENIDEIINLQKDSNGKAKKYQVKQIRKFILKHNIQSNN